jgi:cephalosporin hydroxylase
MQKYMEENLDMPLNQVLSLIQDRTMNKTSYFNVKTLKNPLEYWVYQEMIVELSPDVIIEIGNKHGGSTLYLAHICDLLKKGKIIGVDISHDTIPEFVRSHPRINLIEGDACKKIDSVKELIAENDKVLIIEDSSHTYENTLNVLNTYSPILTAGSYFIVEDSICHHGLSEGPNPGPYEAIESFVENNSGYEIDRGRESFFITWNPKGYLRKKTGITLTSIKSHSIEPRKIIKKVYMNFISTGKLFVPPIINLLFKKIGRK